MILKQLLHNAGAQSLQVVLQSAAILVLYGYLIRVLGVEAFGVWVILTAVNGTSGFASLGLGAGLTRFVAVAEAEGARPRSIGLFLIGGAAGTALATLISGLLLWAQEPVLGLLLPREAIYIGEAIFGWIVAAFWLKSMSSIIEGLLDGLELMRERIAIQVGTFFLFTLLAVALAPALGLLGVAVAQVIGLVAALLGLWLLTLSRLRGDALWPPRLGRDDLKHLLVYGTNIQVMSVLSMLFEPLAKVLLAKFGGLDIVSFFELANRLASRVREVLVAAMRAIVPRVAALDRVVPEQVRSLYLGSLSVMIVATLPTYAVLNASAPWIGLIWIGEWTPDFAPIFGIMSVAWLFNALSAPAYFANLGTGRVWPNTASHAMTAVVMVTMGVGAGMTFGGIAVVWVCGSALLCSSLFVLADYHRADQIFKTERYRPHWPLASVSVAVALAGQVVGTRFHAHPANLLWGGLVITASSLCLLPLVARHPATVRYGKRMLREAFARGNG